MQPQGPHPLVMNTERKRSSTGFIAMLASRHASCAGTDTQRKWKATGCVSRLVSQRLSPSTIQQTALVCLQRAPA